METLKQIVQDYIKQSSKAVQLDASYLTSEFRAFLTWLSITHCITSKARIKKLYEDTLEYQNTADEIGLQYAKGFASGEKVMLENIFGKEISNNPES
jgi:hypothetical protein